MSFYFQQAKKDYTLSIVNHIDFWQQKADYALDMPNLIYYKGTIAPTRQEIEDFYNMCIKEKKRWELLLRNYY